MTTMTTTTTTDEENNMSNNTATDTNYRAAFVFAATTAELTGAILARRADEALAAVESGNTDGAAAILADVIATAEKLTTLADDSRDTARQIAEHGAS